MDQLLKRYNINWASNLAVFLFIRDLTACHVNFHACCTLFVNEVVRKSSLTLLKLDFLNGIHRPKINLSQIQ